MPSIRSAPAHAIVRRSLLARLDTASTGPMTVVLAQAGSGKSVLLSQWVASQSDAGVVWLDVTATDDDPVLFGRRLLTALSAVDPRFAAIAPLIAMGAGGLGGPVIDALALESADAGRLIVVLDDLHLMTNPVLIDDIAALVAALPANVHVVIATRSELPFAFRRRALAEVAEITQAELAMSFADTSELLKRLTGRTITTANVRALIEKTEGWVAGLLLAGVTLRQREDADSYVAQFTGSDRRIAEYLGEEVLSAQTVEHRAALLRLSALDQMSEELVGHLFADRVTRELYADLARSSMFLVALDDRPGWHRFHHLFGSMLRHRLRSEDPAQEQSTVLAAADWHLERGDDPAAVEYLLRAREWERALDVMLDRGPSVFERGEMATMVRWIRIVPQSVLAGRPDVTTIRGILMGLDGEAAEAEDVLRRIVADPGTPFGLAVCAQAFIASLAQWRPHPEISVRQAVRAIDMLEALGDGLTPDLLHMSDPRSLETTTLFSAGRAHFLLGDMEAARGWLARALESDGASYSLWRISALGSLALVEAWCGRTVLADELAREALMIAADVGSLAHPSIADAYLALAVVALDAGDADRAALWLHEGHLRATVNRRTQLLWVTSMLHTLLRDAGASLEQPPAPDGPPPPLVADKLLAASNQRLRRRGRIADVRWPHGAPTDERSASFVEWVSELVEAPGTPAPGIRRWLLSTEGDDRAPRTAVERLLIRSRQAGHSRLAAESQRLLQEAVVVGEPQNLVELFVEAGSDVIDRLATTRMGSAFRQSILDRWRSTAGAATSPAAESLRVPLTGRERQILPYLPTHVSNSGIADELFISLNTVKTHMAHIYEKLGVTGRAAAVTRARELGLL